MRTCLGIGTCALGCGRWERDVRVGFWTRLGMGACLRDGDVRVDGDALGECGRRLEMGTCLGEGGVRVGMDGTCAEGLSVEVIRCARRKGVLIG